MTLNHPDILYHATRKQYVNGILREGLIANAPQSVVNKKVFNDKGVYLTTEQFGWMDWATLEGKHRGAVITINVSGLDLIVDDRCMVLSGLDGEALERECADYLSKENIEPERIMAIAVEETTGGFRQIYERLI